MPDDVGDRSEPPTPRRRMEARERGQVARSQELNAAVMLLVSLMGLLWFGGGIWQALLNVMRASLETTNTADIKETLLLSSASMSSMFWAVSPLIALIFVFGVAVVLSQVGLMFTLKPITPSLDKLNPISGFKRIFSPNSFVQLAQNIAKLLLISGVSYITVKSHAAEVFLAHSLDHAVIVAHAADLVFDLGIKLVLLLIILALIDYIWQKYRHEKQLKMTKDEVKEEMKRMDGDPIIKRRRREIQMKLAAERLKNAVPQADVVVTNPTHYAIAIKYDADSMSAPRVVAKGVDHLAMRIREIAASASIPIVEKPLLARMLYKDVEVGHEIPERFYRAVAEVMAYVYQLAGQNIGPKPVAV